MAMGRRKKRVRQEGFWTPITCWYWTPSAPVRPAPATMPTPPSSGSVSDNVPAREIQSPEGHWFSLRTLPYKTDDKIDGALLVLLNIDAVRQGRSFAEAIIETARQRWRC
jgi:hypothetical protein